MTSRSEPAAQSFESVAQRLDRAEIIGRDHAAILANTTFVMDGWGSIARRLGENLTRLGARRFVLTDPKKYVPASVHSQCTEDEIGRLKVAVGVDWLRQLGAEVIAFAQDIKTVPEGVVAPGSIVITSVDNRRADIVSNRRAVRMGVRLLKVNVESSPGNEVAAVRSYDFRHSGELCVECQFSDRHYAAQRHPQSCDGSFDGRHTNSPAWLSEAAAQLGLLAALDVAAGGPGADRWYGRERQYFPRSGEACDSLLQPKSDCRCDHLLRWQNVMQLQAAPTEVSLRDLLQMAEMAADMRVKVRFCQSLALRGRCDKCRNDFSVVRWIADLQAPVGPCPRCDGTLLPRPFAAFSVTSLEPLLAVLEQPLSQWGVPRFAVVELASDERCTTFVVGGASTLSAAGA